MIKRLKNILCLVLALSTCMLSLSISALATVSGEHALKTLAQGAVVNFAGYKWIVLDPSNGYLFMQDAYESLHSFDSSVTNNPSFDPSSSSNIAYYLNDTFYKSLASAQQSTILNHDWTIGKRFSESSSTKTCKIGLLSSSEYDTYKSSISIKTPESGFWLRTPSDNLLICYVASDFSNGGISPASILEVHPTVYLDPNTAISGDGSNTVIPAVTTSKILGITAPVKGVAPVSTLADTADYTATISWSPSVTTTYEASTVYTATITITPKAGLSLTAVPKNFFTVEGAIATNDAGSGIVTAVFPSTSAADIAIPTAAITGVTAPALDATPVSKADDTLSYTSKIAWSPTATKFAPNTAYTATITITPKTGYTLNGVSENFFKVAGATATNAANSGVVTAVFPATAAAKPLSAMSPGSTLRFAGYTWKVLNPSTGYLMMDENYGAPQPFDSDASYPEFDNTKPSSIAFYLNNTFFNSLSPACRSLVCDHDWTVGQEDFEADYTINCKIGLISSGEKNTYRWMISAAASYKYWTRTVNVNLNPIYYTILGSEINGFEGHADTPYYVRPALYLSPSTVITGGNGGNVAMAGTNDSFTSTVTSSPSMVEADGSAQSTITVKLLDGFGNAVSGKTVELSQGTGSSAITTVTGTSRSDGTAVFKVTDTKYSVVTYTAKNMTDNVTLSQTAKVQFGYPPISTAAIAGVSAPVTGATPVSTIADTEQYTATISWSPSVTTAFEANTAYTANITITPKTGYTLAGVPTNFFKVSGAVTTNSANSGAITAVFPATDKVISASAIAGVAAPVRDGTPVSTIADTDQYTTTISWSPSVTTTFEASTVYTATITITPKTGYTLTGVPANFFKVSGAVATNSANSGAITAVFFTTAAIPTYALTITSGTGGTITTGSSANYKEGTVINISASNSADYIFSKWTSSNGGIFGSETSASTTFTMPANDTSITANFTYNGTNVEAPKVTTTTIGTGANAITTAAIDIVGTTAGGKQNIPVPSDTMTSLTNAVKSAESTGGKAIACINTGSGTGLTNVGVTIPGTQFKAFASGTKAALQIKSGIGSITFSAGAVDKISEAGSDDVTFVIGTVDKSTLSEAKQKLVGSRPVYSLSVFVGSTNVSKFGSSVTVSLPYTLGADENPNAIVVYYIDASGNIKPMMGKYDAKAGTVTFNTTHFSEYMIGYNNVKFNDVAGTVWYSDAVSFIAARGITTGTGDGNFSPEAKLTRAQFLVMVMRAYGISADQSIKDNFSDAGSTYYTAYLATAKKLGIASGIGNNQFAPENAITRQEMFTLLYNTLKQLGELPAITTGKTLTDFSDSNEIAAWAKDATTLLVGSGTVVGSDGKLSPRSTSTRAEMAKLLYNLLAI